MKVAVNDVSEKKTLIDFFEMNVHKFSNRPKLVVHKHQSVASPCSRIAFFPCFPKHNPMPHNSTIVNHKPRCSIKPRRFDLQSSSSPENAFCFCREFQFSVREMLSIQSSLRRSRGRTLGYGNLLAEIVT